MKYLIVVLSLISFTNCLQRFFDIAPYCDFDLNTVKEFRQRVETFRQIKAVDPTDSSKKLKRYSSNVLGTGIRTIRITLGDDFFSEHYKTVGNNLYIATQKGLYKNSTNTINYELTDVGYKFEQLPTGNKFEVPLKSLDSELPSSSTLNDNFKTTFNTIVAKRKKFYAVKDNIEMDNLSIRFYNYDSNDNGYYLEYYETIQTLTEKSKDSGATGYYRCCNKYQKYTVVNDDIQLIDEPTGMPFEGMVLKF